MNKPKTSDSAKKFKNIDAKIENEIEARFLVPKHTMKPYLACCKKLRIKQFYVPKKNRAKALKQIIALKPQAKDILGEDLKTFRIRAQKSVGSQFRFFAQFKTEKKSLSRTEISIPINKSAFNTLKKFADEGFVSKNRLIKSMNICLDGKLQKIEAHIDIITGLGVGQNQLCASELPKFLKKFLIIEIELPNEKSYSLLKNLNWADFSFLNEGIDLQEIKARSIDRISFRSLAKGRLTRGKIQKVFEKVRKAA